MAVACPVCGTLSVELDFCETCQADLRALVSLRAPSECPVGPEAVLLSEEDRVFLSHPESFLVVQTRTGWQRIHWLDRHAETDWHTAWQQRREQTLQVLSRTRHVDVPEGTWVFAPTRGASAAPWLACRRASPLEELQAMIAFAAELAELLEHLHRHQLLWLNFDPGELERNDQGELAIANLDLRVFPFGHAPHTLAVHQAYVAPEVVYLKAAELGPRTDVYHLSSLCYYWLARRLPGGLPGEGLEAIDFHPPPLRVYAPHVPEGIAAILSRGMAPESHHRFATPGQFVQNLREALERAQKRRASTIPLAWDLGSHTRAGRVKTALKRGNEDQAMVSRLSGPERAFVAVADGITTCDIGSGALASFITTIVLENTLDATVEQSNFTATIQDACLKSSQTILDWAIEKGHRDDLLQGKDLMGTTLTAGWLQGTNLLLANLGDSRAYLIENLRIEQLTVDGDLASDMYAQGTPPESVRDIGHMGKALRQCIGGCEVLADGKLVILEDASNPSLSRWALLPGDVVVLCTDGLVEEGAFLEPEILVEIVRNHPRATAQELADLFCDAADSLQRLPSMLEPEGFGDNVSCVVVKVSAKE